MAEAAPTLPLQVFLSYAHQDEELCEEFRKHLSELKRQGWIDPWHDRRITAGEDWRGAIDDHLKSAHIVILLVSADFLASDYCNDVEMNLALERAQQGKARVVPVILRPCDWETSRFGKFQALPKGGKPLVDWKTNDHGFADVARGLRRTIDELCNPAPAAVRVVRAAVRRHPWRWVVGAALVLALGAVWWSSHGYLQQGMKLLNAGQNASARTALQTAKSLNPFNRTAGAYLKVLDGDQKYRMGDRQGAFADYQEAVKTEPDLAEAHFDIGRILDLDGDHDASLEEYQKAVQLSPKTPRYRSNLADLYFHREEYDKAIEEYGRMGEFPLAALEIAKIYRLQGKLDNARGREEDAIRWLKDPAVKKAEEPNAWAFDVSPTQLVRLTRFEEKQCYADLELAITRFLQGDENKVVDAVPAAFEKCSSRQPELKDILQWELRRLGNQAPSLRPRCDAFVERFLTP